MALIFMSLGFKLVKSVTWEEFISLGFMFTKLGGIVLFAFMDYRLAVYYALICFVLWLVLK